MKKLFLLLLILAFPCRAQYISSGYNKGTITGGTPNLVSMTCSGATNENVSTPFHVNIIYGGSAGTGTLANNFLILVMDYAHGLTVSSLTDNKSSTYTAGPKADGGTSNPITDMRYVFNAAAGISAITVTLSGTSFDFHWCAYEYNNIQTSSDPIDGNCHSIDTGPTTPQCDATFTPTTSGDLIFAATQDQGGASSQLCTDPSTSFTAGSGFTLTWATFYCSNGAESKVQSPAAAINPSFTTAGSADGYNVVAAAFKSATAGTAPGTNSIKHQGTVFLNAATQTFPWPSSGNSLAVVVDDVNNNSTGAVITFSSCTNSNSFTKYAPNTNNPQIFYATSGTTTGSTLKCTFTNGNSGNSTLARLYDFNAGSHDADSGAASGTESSTTVDHAPDVTPTAQPGIAFGVIAIGNGPTTAIQTANGVYDNTTYSGETDSSKMNNGNGFAHVFYTATSTIDFKWTVVNNSSSWQAIASTFKF